jgi:hypothetical protein
VAGTPREYYHGSNWETSQEKNSTAAQLLSVGGPPRCFTINPNHLMYNGSQLSSVAGTPRDPTWRSSEECNSSSSSEEVYHWSSSSEEVYPDGDERPPPPSNICTPLGNITNTPNTQSIIPEWDGCNPDSVVKSMKALDKDQLKELGIRELYKSYGSWEKMSIEQRSKVVSYFCALPDEFKSWLSWKHSTTQLLQRKVRCRTISRRQKMTSSV